MYIKGQNFRVKINGKYVACATSCSLHVAANLEDATTKDSTGPWQEQACVGKSWDGQAEGVMSVQTTNDTTGVYAPDLTELVGETVTIEYEQTTGAKNRVAADAATGEQLYRYSGSAIINDVSISAPNRQNTTYTVQFTGTGELVRLAVSSETILQPADPETTEES